MQLEEIISSEVISTGPIEVAMQVTRRSAWPLVMAGVSVVLWASLAALVRNLSYIPPFFLVGVALGIGSLPALVHLSAWRVRPAIILFGTGGIFGYHFLLFLALRFAPPVEANLLNYLWPVLIVIFASLFLPGQTLKLQHVIGGGLAFAGAALVITGGAFQIEPKNTTGYILAIAAAITWAVYSVGTKRLPPIATPTVGVFCFCSALLALLCHITLEVIPVLKISDWLMIGLLGIGPMGIAFYTWNWAIQNGNPRAIGAISYLTPLLSTTLLLLTEPGSHLSGKLIVSTFLILGGAVVSTRG